MELYAPSSIAARTLRFARVRSSTSDDVDRLAVAYSAGRNGSCIKPMRTRESVAEPGGKSEVKTYRSAGAYVAQRAGTHSKSRRADAASSALFVSVSAAPASSSAARGAGTSEPRACPIHIASDSASDGALALTNRRERREDATTRRSEATGERNSDADADASRDRAMRSSAARDASAFMSPRRCFTGAASGERHRGARVGPPDDETDARS